jgi:PBSX family phage terminase large subunit
VGKTIRYELRGAADALTRSTSGEVLLSGAAGTGKSVGALLRLHLAALAVPRVKILLVRKTAVSLTSSTLVTFREKVANDAIDAGLVKFYGGSAEEPASYRYVNGSRIVMGGLDKSTRLLSTEYDLIFVDEAIEVSEEDLDTLASRLRNGAFPVQQLIMCTNPGPPTHHLKVRADTHRAEMLLSQHEDNPRMHDGRSWTKYGGEYLARLDKLTGPRLKRLRYGVWAAADGLVYEGFDPAQHVLVPFTVPAEWPLYITIDWGFRNPAVVQWWRLDHDGRAYLTREIYHTGKLVEDLARLVVEVLDSHPEEPTPTAVIADHDAEDRATFERHSGLTTTPAYKAVTPGIQAMEARIRVQEDGRPRLYVFEDATLELDETLKESGRPTSTEAEFLSYVWDIKPGTAGLKERPVKEHDHGMDAARYLIAQLDVRDVGVVKSPLQAGARTTGGGGVFGQRSGTRTGARYSAPIM